MMEVTASRKSGSRPRGYIENYKPQRRTLALLHDAMSVLEEYEDYWPLTIRQVYYRLAGARGYPKTEEFYGKLCHHMANARRGRMIEFDAIRDDGASVMEAEHWDDEDHFRRYIRGLGARYTRNKLSGQECHIEVWCEAAGMMPQLARVAHDYSISVYSSSGFDSLTAKKGLASRICAAGKPAVILHLGDHDPSGQSIFDSVAEDVTAFVAEDRLHAQVDVRFERVALTAEQVSHYDLPTAPPKASDSRTRSWKKGETCQLEALAPNILARILRVAIAAEIDHDQYDADRELEKIERRSILALPAPGDDR